MKRVGEIIQGVMDFQEHKQEKTNEKCLVCGYEVEFVDGQYKKRCPKCGMMIHAKINRKVVHIRPKCKACSDTGWVQYPVQTEGRLYNYVARCDCPAGMRYSEKIPSLSQCQEAPMRGEI
jgi:predicted RNA-binding Zn-ribbon protein involved in translation (DUF1610 family)